MKRKIVTFCLLALALVATGCKSRTETSKGGVILSVQSFGTLPIQVSLGTGPFQIDRITLRSIPKVPTDTSALQDIEIRSYEVTYTRLDTGTRLPPPLVQSIFGTVSVGATTDLLNLPFLLTDQVGNPPMSDLTTFGADQQTGSAVIPLRVTMRFFGRTIAGDEVASNSASFNIEVRP